METEGICAKYFWKFFKRAGVWGWGEGLFGVDCMIFLKLILAR
jgi:hypothetical protein